MPWVPGLFVNCIKSWTSCNIQWPELSRSRMFEFWSFEVKVQHFVQDTIWKTRRCPRLTLRSYKMPSVDWSRSFVRRWENFWKKKPLFLCCFELFHSFCSLCCTWVAISCVLTLRVSEKTLSEAVYNFQLSAFRPIALQISWFVTFVCLTRKDTTTCGLRCERCCCRCWNESRLSRRFAYRVHEEVAFLGILCEAWPWRRGSHKCEKHMFCKSNNSPPEVFKLVG